MVGCVEYQLRMRETVKVTDMKSTGKKYKSMSQKEITHLSTQMRKAVILSNKSGNVRPFDLFELENHGAKKAKSMLKNRKV